MDIDDIPRNRLYNDLAYLWPLLSPPVDYAEEATHWRHVLHRELGPGRHEILELGVGGGHNLSHLAAEFKATAVDISEPMLALSRKLNPNVTHLAGDMRSFRMQKKFNAVLIHDAISHMTTERDLRAVFATAKAHLEPGGIMIVSPDWLCETFESPWTAEVSASSGNVSVNTFEYIFDRDPADTNIEAVMTHLIKDDRGYRIELDCLTLGLFPHAVWRRAITGEGMLFSQYEFHLDSTGVDCLLMVGKNSVADVCPIL